MFDYIILYFNSQLLKWNYKNLNGFITYVYNIPNKANIVISFQKLAIEI